jgi:DNA modification methylase
LHPAPAAEHEARLILTDPPYNVPVAGHVTSRSHRELLMAAGEMSDAEFLAFNTAWIGASLRHLRDGGLFGTFIDWRGYPAVLAAILQLSLEPLNLIVWAKTNAGMGSLYRSQHELLPLFKKGNMGRLCRSRCPQCLPPPSAQRCAVARSIHS